MKIGVLGGTFDPVHEGHLHIAREAKRLLGLSKVLFVPNHLSPLKTDASGASAAERLAMLRLAIRDIPHFEISTVEIERGGLSYTVDTLRELKKQYPKDKLFFLIGADIYDQMASWKEADKIPELCTVAVSVRPGFAFTRLGVETFTHEPCPYAATQIRAELRAGESPKGLPPAVLRYIRSKGLYVAKSRKGR